MPKPVELLQFIPEWDWDIEKLHGLTHAYMVELPIDNLVPMLFLPYWSKDATSEFSFDLRPIDACLHRDKLPEQFKRVQDANLTYPIDVLDTHNRKLGVSGFLILDGMHRICKAAMIGKKLITARVHDISVKHLIEVVR